MNKFEYTSCDNENCKMNKDCKRYVMWKLYGATDVKRGGGTNTSQCKRYLAMKGKR